MSIAQLAPSNRSGPTTTVDVDIVIPVYNEEAQLAASIARLRTFLATSFPFTATITVADNASTDRTWPIAVELAATYPEVRALQVQQKGRGRALRTAWAQSAAVVVAYMDVDLATDLDALVPLVAPLLSGHSDLAIGTRLARGAHVVRGVRREIISRSYNLLLRSALRSSCTDAQCGFKALRREAADQLLPHIEDEGWFFDTELLVTAQRLDLRIQEVPVHWVDDADSRVDVVPTALGDLRGVWRMLRGAYPGRLPTPERRRGEVFADELLRFAGVGVVSTLCYVALFAAFRSTLGAYGANALAIGLCSLANTAVHRSLVGTARARLGRWGRWMGATSLLGVSLGLTTAAVAVTTSAGLESLLPELMALTVANLVAAVVRFAILRAWVFRPVLDGNAARAADLPGAPPGSASDPPRRRTLEGPAPTSRDLGR